MDYVTAFFVSVIAGITVEILCFLWHNRKRK